LDTGKPPNKRQGKIRPLTFREVGEFLKFEWNNKFHQDSLSEKTHSDYCYWLDILIRRFRNKMLCQITQKEVEDYINDLAAKYSKTTPNKHLSIIKKVFHLGLNLSALTSNPVSEIRSFKEKERSEFLLPRQLDRLLNATQKNRGKFYMPAIICLGAEHGASKQEILSLRWSDIDFDFEERGLVKLFRRKNRKKRIEFLMPRTKESLLAWRDHLRWKRKKSGITRIKSDFVFTRIDGTPLKSFNKSWWASLRNAEINNFHFHDLRHTFCSNLILSGANLKDAKEMIGHKDISMTDRYSHLTLSHKLQKQNQLADYYMNGAK
jgi:integrase